MRAHQEEMMKKMVDESNLATKDDIAELKKQLDKLAKKLDAQGKK
jgi:polyhydroxyalkanoate synthesis regulator phasin